MVKHRPSRSCSRVSRVLKLHSPSINFQRGLSAFAEIQFLRKGLRNFKRHNKQKRTLIEEPKSFFGFRQCPKSAHILSFSKQISKIYFSILQNIYVEIAKMWCWGEEKCFASGWFYLTRGNIWLWFYLTGVASDREQ